METPAVGTQELRILTPTLLELTLVTTKEPDPAPITTWNFVGANFTLNLPAVSEFAVTANGSSIPVSQAGFRRRALYAPLKTRDLRIGNSIFLKLSVPLLDGQTVAVQNPSGALWSNPSAYAAVVSSTRFNPGIHVNQVGYQPTFTKKAMVGMYLGSLGELVIPNTTFHLLDAQTFAVRYTGTLTPRRDSGYTYSPTPYQNVLEADFSNFQSPGEYVLQVAGMRVSHKFQIHEGTAAVFARSLALGLYHQRCGGENAPPYTRHEHGTCHAAPAEVPTAAYTAVNATLANVSSDYASNPLHTARQLSTVDASLYPFVNRGPIDVRGGHHDAGDYSKYTINSAGLIHHLVFAVDSFPGVSRLDNLGLPESGDGKSDLLQEAKWEADFLAKMQDADGGFYFLVYPRDRRYEDDVLPDQGDPQVVFPKTTAVTAAAVAALAEIASSPSFRAQFPAEASAYLEKARRGWAFLTNAINTHGKNGSYQKITHYGNEFMHDDELAWAAAAMFAATGEVGFHHQLRAWYDPADPQTRRWSWWRLFEGYGCAARTYAFAVRSGRLPAVSLDGSYLAKCEAEIIAAGDDIERFARLNAYGTSFPDLNKAYRSAGWYFSSERAFEMAVADQIRPSNAYLNAIISNMNYEGGCNPVNIPFITGLGWQAWRDIVHQYAQNDYQILPPAGLPLGNIQAGFAYLENYKQSLGQLSFPPDGASTAPYPFYDRWGDSFNTTTEFVVVDQSRAIATMAYCLAKTAYANQAYTRTAASISGLPAIVPAGQTITAIFNAPGIDLTGTRVTWEARDQQPYIGPNFTFAARNSGEQWIEAEALLPDGRRISCKTNFTASYQTSTPPNAYQSAPVSVSSETIAVYDLDGTLTDAAGKSPTLALSGNARLNNVNLGWMSDRSGAALRVDDLGDKAVVTLPANLLRSSNTTEISIEAMVFVELYKGWNRASAKLLSLEQSWNASLKWFEDMYSGIHIGGGVSFDQTGAALASALPTGKWHHLRIGLSATGYTIRANGNLVASMNSTDLNLWNSGSGVVEFGNFSGWIDEVVIRSKGGGSTVSGNSSLAAPPPVTDLQARTLSTSQVSLTWSDTSTNEQGFRAYRSIDNVNFLECASVSSNSTSCTVGSLAANTSYYFAVKAYNGAGESSEAITSARTLSVVPSVPGAPTGVTIALASSTSLRIFWIPVTGSQGYTAKRSPNPGGPFVAIASLTTNTFQIDFPPRVGVTYYYVVSSRSSLGESPNSVPVTGSLISPTANVQLLGVNSSRKGTWAGVIGQEGYLLAGDTQRLPSYGSVSFTGKSDWIWEYTTADVRALQRPTGTSRLAACWYSPTSFDINLDLTDGQFHKISLYTVDWDRASRRQQMDVIDAVTGRYLHTCYFATTGEGAYLEYLLQGRVKIRYTRFGGPNAVVSGIFFDSAK